MPRVAWFITLLFALALLACFVAVFFPPSLRATIQETLTNESPEAKIRAYVQAVARGDEGAALNVWELPTGDGEEKLFPGLGARRLDITRALLNNIQPRFEIRAIEWWRTCCEPGVIDTPRDAGGARVSVELFDTRGSAQPYHFDVFVRGGAYWGAAEDYPAREWVLRDVYPADSRALFWKFDAPR
jgi:hypothetical protein